jgi:hypothetical protein
MLRSEGHRRRAYSIAQGGRRAQKGVVDNLIRHSRALQRSYCHVQLMGETQAGDSQSMALVQEGVVPGALDALRQQLRVRDAHWHWELLGLEERLA